jgi:hypothetical protein
MHNPGVSRRGNAYAHLASAVIASEAKQSIGHPAKCGLLRRFAPRNDGPYRFATLLCKAFRAIQLERPGLSVHMAATVLRMD